MTRSSLKTRRHSRRPPLHASRSGETTAASGCPGQARPNQRPAHRSLPGLCEETAGQRRERANDGAVDSGENTAISVISYAGTGSSGLGSISGNPFH